MAFDAKAYHDRAERALYGETREEWHARMTGGGNGGGSTPSRPTGGYCGDCGGTKDCIHCNGGVYPRRNGTMAPCGKCHGRLKCHACRGKGFGGSRCGTPTHAEMVARAKKGGAGRVAGNIAGAIVAGTMGALNVGSALTSPQQNSIDTQGNWAETTVREEGERRQEGMDRDTRAAGDRRKWSGRRR